MSDTPLPLHEMVHDLARRVEAIESRLDIRPERVEPELAEEQLTPPTPGDAAVETASAGENPDEAWVVTSASEAARDEDDTWVAPAPAPAPSVSGPWNFERLLGGRLFAVAGALVVIAGVAMALKLAWDQGYFGRLSDGAKALSMGVFGAALLGAGEWARRRFGRAAGEGPVAAGLGVWFATVYAMAAPFGMLSVASAAGLYFAVAAAGFAISVRGGLVVAPSVVVAAGFVSPLLIGAFDSVSPVVPLYWLSLGVMAHALCARFGDALSVPRALSWWGLVLIGGAWAWHAADAGRTEVSIAYAVGVWILSHAGVAHQASRVGTTSAWQAAGFERAAASLATVSLWAAGLGIVCAENIPGASAWHGPGVVAAACGVWALLVAGGPRGLLGTPATSRESLGVAVCLTGGALALTAAALGLGGWIEPVSIVLVGLASVAAGTRLTTAWLSAYGLVTLSVGTVISLGAVTLIDDPAYMLGTIRLTRWSAVVGVAASAWFAVGLLRRGTVIGATSAAVSLVLFAVVPVVGEVNTFGTAEPIDARWINGAWGLLALLWLLGGRVLRGLRLREIGYTGLLIASLQWYAAYVSSGWSSGVVYGEGLMSVREGVLAALGFVVALLLAAGSVSRLTLPALAHTGRALALVLLLVVTTLEAARLTEFITDDSTARRAIVSVWWGIYGLGLTAAGGLTRAAALRLSGLILMSAATFKAVLYDLADVAPAWRVVSFLTLGVLLLAVATAYARWRAREIATRSDPC